MSETRVPAIPSVTDRTVVDAARAIKQILDIREGRAGDKLDANVTFRDLVGVGLASVPSYSSTGANGFPVIPSAGDSGAYDPTQDLTTPPPPHGFTATSLFSAVKLDWVLPSILNYAYTEIWRGDTDALGDAVKIATSITTSYVDYLGASVTRYYWIRFVSQANITGPYNAVGGTPCSTVTDPGYLLDLLSNSISESELATSLGSRINLIDGPESLDGSVSARLKTERESREEADSVLSETLTTVSASVGDVDARVTDVESSKIGYCTINGIASDETNRTACEAAGGTWNVGLPMATAVKQVSVSDGLLSATLEQRFTAQRGTNGDLLSQYTVKIDNRGHVSGFGLASTEVNGAPTSAFVVRADRFAIVGTDDATDPLGTLTPTNRPFIVATSPTTINGVSVPAGTYVNTAFIGKATIKAAQIGSVSADTIQAGFTSSVDSESSTFFGSEFYIGGAVTYEYNAPGEPTRKTGIAGVSNPNIALKLDGAEFDVNYFKIKNRGSLTTPFQVVNDAVQISTALIGSGTITSAKIADTIQSTNWSETSAQGWQINKSGNMTINNGTFRGVLDVKSASSGARLEISGDTIRVYDENGRLRVRIGKLT